MKDVEMTKENFNQILRIEAPIEFDTSNHKINFHIDSEDKFYLLSGFWNGLDDFVRWLHKGHQYVECYADLYDNGFIILYFETIYGDKEPVEIHPIGEGADLLLEKLKELRSEHSSKE